MDNEEVTRWAKRKARTRELLKSATIDLLMERGYSDVTIQDITDRADVARGTFYIHFTDKEDITWTILRESIDALAAEALSQYQDEPYHRRKFLVWRRVFAYARDNRDLLRIMLGDRGHPVFALRIQDYLAQIIERAIAGAMFAPNVSDTIPMGFVAQFTTGALVRLMIWSLDGEGAQYTPEELGRFFYETLVRQPMPDEAKE
jgi:AcrR family transcriptional regulator